MPRLSRVWLALGFFAVGMPLAAAPKQPEFPPCIQVGAFARYGAYGYDHIVTIANGCERAAACVVTTNVNPQPIGVQVEPERTETVVTFRGSPASKFSATVRCKLQP